MLGEGHTYTRLRKRGTNAIDIPPFAARRHVHAPHVSVCIPCLLICRTTNGGDAGKWPPGSKTICSSCPHGDAGQMTLTCSFPAPCTLGTWLDTEPVTGSFNSTVPIASIQIATNTTTHVPVHTLVVRHHSDCLGGSTTVLLQRCCKTAPLLLSASYAMYVSSLPLQVREIIGPHGGAMINVQFASK